MTTKTLSILIVSIFTVTSINAQNLSKIKVPRPNSSIYLLTPDSLKINIEIAEKVALNLGMQRFTENAFSRTYIRKFGFMGLYSTVFFSQPINPEIDSYIQLHNKKLNLNANEMVYVYGFTSALGEGKRVDRNYSRMMMSAYLQEINPEYKSNNIFSSLNKLDKSEFWKRNWINMGYGIRYATKDNPFASGSDFASGFLYIWDTLHYIPILGGAFIGETTSDKIMIPVVGLAGLVLFKGIVGGICKKYININNNIHSSGYLIPNEFNY